MVAESAGPAGPAGRNNDQIGVQRHAVGADTGGPVAPDADLDDMANMQIHSRLGLHGRSEDPLEGRPAASHRHQLLGPVRSWRTGHRLGTGGEQVVQHLGQFRLPRLDHLGAKCVRVVKLHHPTQQLPAGDRGDQVPDRDVRGQPGPVGERGRRDCVERVTHPGAGRGEGGDDVTVELGEPVDGRGAQPLDVFTAHRAQPAADRDRGAGEVTGDPPVPSAAGAGQQRGADHRGRIGAAGQHRAREQHVGGPAG